MSEILLDVNDLHIDFDTYEGIAKVINGIDFTINSGESVALVGESGCGKSVTARAILGVLRDGIITEGEMVYKGRDLVTMTDSERHALRGDEMSMILQDPMSSLNPVFTIGEQMMDIQKYQGKRRLSLREYIKDKFRTEKNKERKEDILDMLSQVQISSPERVFESYPVELSGGMRQRVLIAMSLLSEPDLLLCDEPGTALDVTTEEEILELLDDLCTETDTGVLYITHDLGVARQVAEKIIVMYAGEIVETAPTQQFFDSPKHPYSRGLLDSIPHLSKGMGEGIEGYLPAFTEPLPACRFAERCPYSEQECYEIYPHPRAVEKSHNVACHLYSGEPVIERNRVEQEEVDIGIPPWESEEQEESQKIKSVGDENE
jgi:peptide/nickel transport system ATP-binding protein